MRKTAKDDTVFTCDWTESDPPPWEARLLYEILDEINALARSNGGHCAPPSPSRAGLVDVWGVRTNKRLGHSKAGDERPA